MLWLRFDQQHILELGIMLSSTPANRATHHLRVEVTPSTWTFALSS
jgi:hypothetical protein